MIFDYLLVGSGPSSTGFLSSEKILNKKVCIVDAGIEYKKKYKSHLSDSDLYKIHNLKHKTYFGQDEATNYKVLFDSANNLNINNSYMTGGLSNVWGAASVNYDKKSLAFMGIAHDLDHQIKFINKLIHNNKNEIHPNSFVSDIFNKLNKSSMTSKAYQSTLAINMKTCIKCGSCFYGCAYNSIYNSENDFKKYATRFINYKGYLVYKLLNRKNFYEIVILDLKTNEKKIIKSKKIILGCGAINSSKLLLRSFSNIDYINVADSQHFLLPLISYDFKKILKSPQVLPIELSNFFIESIVDQQRIHGQFYSFGPFFKNQVKKFFHINTSKFDSIFNIAYIYQAYLPSTHSSCGQFKRVGGGGSDIIEFNKINNYDKKLLDNITHHISSYFRKANLITIKIAKRIWPMYSSYHFGAMKIFIKGNLVEPCSNDGSVATLRDIHLIDSSVLRNLPSGPITSLVMANARFIANNIL